MISATEAVGVANYRVDSGILVENYCQVFFDTNLAAKDGGLFRNGFSGVTFCNIDFGRL